VLDRSVRSVEIRILELRFFLRPRPVGIIGTLSRTKRSRIPAMMTLLLLCAMGVLSSASAEADAVQIGPDAKFADSSAAVLRWDNAGAAAGGFLESPPIRSSRRRSISGVQHQGPGAVPGRTGSAHPALRRLRGRRAARVVQCGVGIGVLGGPGPGGRSGGVGGFPILLLRTAASPARRGQAEASFRLGLNDPPGDGFSRRSK